LQNRDYFLPTVSRTFHGRDIFAPVAAHIAKGVAIGEFGRELSVDELVKLPALRAEIDEQFIRAPIVHIDRFGNAITNLRREDFSKWLSLHGHRGWTAKIGCHRFKTLCQTYAEVPTGEPLLLFNSYDLLEVAVNRGNAAEQLDIRKGDVLEIWAEGADAK